jgi:hypothetical protein
MSEGTRPNGMMKPAALGADYPSDQAIESAAVAGAAAVQRLINDRNGLRKRMSVQDRELMEVRAAHEDLRRRVVTLQQSYIELAKRVVAEMEQFDSSIRDLLQERHDLAAPDGKAAVSPPAQRQFDRNGFPVGALPPGADPTLTNDGTSNLLQKGRSPLEG